MTYIASLVSSFANELGLARSVARSTKAHRNLFLAFTALCILVSAPIPAHAFNLVSKITSAPVFANGTVRDIRTGINIFLQRSDAPNDQFLDPAVIGYGLKPAGRMEIELVSGFERDPKIPLDPTTILLVAGTPQQAITSRLAGYTVTQGKNPNTFVITPSKPEGMPPKTLTAAAPAAQQDPIPQKGIKIIHIGRNMAFTNRGKAGKIAVRIFDETGSLEAQGNSTIDFLPTPRPQVFPTNIPDGKRNRNWQRVKAGEVAGVSPNTLPLSFLLFDRNEDYGNKGLDGVGVLSKHHIEELEFDVPASLSRFNGGLLLMDKNGDGLLDPATDAIIGGIKEHGPLNASSGYVVSPARNNQPYLSRPTGLIDPKAAKRPGGSILDVFYVAGEAPGTFRLTFSLLEDLDDPGSGDGSSYTYTILVE